MLWDITQNYYTSGKSTVFCNSSNYKACCNHSHCYHRNSLSFLMHTTSWGLLKSERALQYLGEHSKFQLILSIFSTLVVLNHFPSKQIIMLISQVLLARAMSYSMRMLRNLSDTVFQKVPRSSSFSHTVAVLGLQGQ